MVAERKYVNLEDHPDLAALVTEANRTRTSIAILENGEVKATVEPARRSPGEPGKLTDEEIAAFRATSGGWIGLVDTDQLRRDIEESRRLPPKPPVDLDV